jgi:proteasome accessory factor C
LEAKALLMALDLVGPLVAAAAGSDLQRVRARLNESFGRYGSPTVPETEPSTDDQAILNTLATALSAHEVLDIEYYSQSRGELSVRSVEPLAVQRMRSHWYLVAWCQKASDVRSFRIDRIKSAGLATSTFEPRDIDLSGYEADTPSTLEASPRTAQVLFAPAVARWIVEGSSAAHWLTDGSALVTVTAASDSWLVEEILKYRGLATLVSPGELRSLVQERAAALMDEMLKVPVA